MLTAIGQTTGVSWASGGPWMFPMYFNAAVGVVGLVRESGNIHYRIDAEVLTITRRFRQPIRVGAAYILEVRQRDLRTRRTAFATWAPRPKGGRGIRIERLHNFPLFVDPEDPDAFVAALGVLVSGARRRVDGTLVAPQLTPG